MHLRSAPACADPSGTAAAVRHRAVALSMAALLVATGSLLASWRAPDSDSSSSSHAAAPPGPIGVALGPAAASIAGDPRPLEIQPARGGTVPPVTAVLDAVTASTATATSSTTTITMAPALPAALRYGLIGNDGTHLAAERTAGIGTKLFELNWAAWEPSPGVYSAGYLTWVKRQLAALRRAGFAIVLSLGVQFAPSWLLSAYPDAYYVDQYGDRYADTCSGCEIPNFVWNTALRREFARYVAHAFAVLGTSFAAVRIGGGHFGELGYPTASYNGHSNTYWAFDANAAASDPVPGWRPGMSSPNGEAGKFLNWYLGKLANYERWQITTLRASYRGPLMLLIPAFGIRPGQAAAAVAGRLAGTTSAERNGEIQRGYDYARFVASITDPGVVLDTTWLDCPYGNDASTNPVAWRPVHYLAYLAARNPHHLRLYGENTGQGSAAVLAFTAAQARKYRLAGFLWFDEQELFSGFHATLAAYATLIR
jgi:Beta-galactosidase